MNHHHHIDDSLIQRHHDLNHHRHTTCHDVDDNCDPGDCTADIHYGPACYDKHIKPGDRIDGQILLDPHYSYSSYPDSPSV